MLVAGAAAAGPKCSDVPFPGDNRAPQLAGAFLQRFCADQKAIWTAPAHAREGVQWLGPLVVASAALLGTDRQTSAALPNTPAQRSAGRLMSNAGIGYIVGVPAAFLLWGALGRNPERRDTGLGLAQALADSAVAVQVLKRSFGRERPTLQNGQGRFFNTWWGPGFPSGHSALAWSVSSVLAHRYPDSPLVVAGAYSAASAIALSRVAARGHFFADIVVGSAIGWLIGEYVSHRIRRAGRTDTPLTGPATPQQPARAPPRPQ